MMTPAVLFDLISQLRTEAAYSVWAEHPEFPPEADPSTTRHILFGYAVCWAKSNTSPCPTEEEITAYQNQL